jgi:hypothetical protein
MPGFGWHNPMPMTFGGGATRTERIYVALRSAAGKGGSAADDSGIEGLRRKVIARALAAVTSGGERAALQAFPHLATDLLPYYERIYGLADDPDLTEAERREAAAQLYTLQLAASLPEIAASLAAIDERFSIVSIPDSLSIITVAGRAFEDYDGAEPFGGGRQSTALPNYSTRVDVVVLLDIADGVAPGITELRSMQRAARLLHDVLPNDASYHIITHLGFAVGVSLLGFTGLEEE